MLPISNAESSTPIAARSALVQLADGAFDQDGYEAHFNPQRLSYRCEIFGQPGQDVDDELDILLTALGEGRKILKAKMRNGVEYRQTWAKIISVQRERGAASPYRQPVILELEQDYPYWLASSDEPWYLDNGDVLDIDLGLDAGNFETKSITSTPHNSTITNSGTIRCRRGTISIIPEIGASIVNPKIENFTSGDWIKFTGTISAGSTLSIDLLSRTVEIDGVDAYSGFSVSNKRTWMELERGDNLIRVTGMVSGTIILRWLWARHYL
jgi:hypothetical protein